jgi:hypothetical protein
MENTTEEKQIQNLTKLVLQRCKDRIKAGETIPKEPTLYSLKRKWL